MKLLIASDIHGDLCGAETVCDVFQAKNCDKILLLGDLLYHGPRNDLPETYAPKKVIEILNALKEKILCVRGNCEAEVDQMVLGFPCLSDSCLLSLDGVTVFATHGHRWNLQTPPPLSGNDVLLHGHTHIPAKVSFGNGNVYLNPGSVSLPKNGNPKTYMMYEKRTFTLFDFTGNVLWAYEA